MLKNLKGKIPREGQAIGGAQGLVELIASMAEAIDRLAGEGVVDVTWRAGRPVISVAAGATFSGVTEDDFEEIDVLVPTTEWNSDDGLIQFKKRTVKVLKESGSVTNAETIVFSPYDD